MNAIDFEYDGQRLSDYGFIVCDFDYSNGSVVANSGSKLTFNKVQIGNGSRYALTNTKYDECVQCTFDICKDPDLFEYEDRLITSEEHRRISRWLNRKEFLKFSVVHDDDDSIDYHDYCYFNASFNVEKIKIAEKQYGIRLTMESDSPFGQGREMIHQFDFSPENSKRVLLSESDEIGYIYPDMIISCGKSGDLTITNEVDGKPMVIRNCSPGEVITINGKSQTISTTYNSHDICNDFNYEFFRIYNSFRDRANRIVVSSPCKITFKYIPMIKDVP